MTGFEQRSSCVIEYSSSNCVTMPYYKLNDLFLIEIRLFVKLIKKYKNLFISHLPVCIRV